MKLPRWLALFACVVSLVSVAAPAAQISADAEALFVRRVSPLLHDKCLACHGNDEAKIKGGLDLRTRAEALFGGDSGKPAFVADKPEESPLYLAVTRSHADWEAMPPKEADALTSTQITDLKTRPRRVASRRRHREHARGQPETGAP